MASPFERRPWRGNSSGMRLPHPTRIPKTYDQKNAMKKRQKQKHNDKWFAGLQLEEYFTNGRTTEQCQIDQKET
jgi:hypothetical protein